MAALRRGSLLSLLEIVLFVCMAMGLSAPAAAVPPDVKTVRWVASNPLIPHDTWDGKEVTLKGTADVQGADIEYTWDFGDGGFASGTVTDRYAIEARHTYTGNVGDIFTARLTVEDTSTGEFGSATYFVEIRPQNLATEVNVAIDEALWYLHKTQARGTEGGIEVGHWNQGTSCSAANPLRCASTTWFAATPANVNAFAVNGHVEEGDPANPYTETVARGVRWMFGRLVTDPISPRTYPAPTGTVDPDSNGNGYGVRVNQGNYPYQGGMFMDAIIAAGRPDAVSVLGEAPAGADPGVLGRTYADIVQDMVDAYAFGQDNGGSNRGGWRYAWNQGPDNSASQWAAIGMIAAERVWGLTIPDWVKTENQVWLAYSQTTSGTEAGRFGYTNTSPSNWGPYAVTPSGMVQLAMSGAGRGDPRWDMAETWIRDRFENDTSNAITAIRDYYYGLFSFTKSMLLHDSNADGVAEPITLLQSSTLGVDPIDWYAAEAAAGDPSDGVARTLVNDQEPEGYWYTFSGREHSYDGRQYPFETAFAVIMLKRTVFQAGSPVAVAQATPNPAVAGGIVRLDGSTSFHQDATRSIVQYEWDLDDDGVFDVTGRSVDNVFPGLGDFPVTLRVTDNSVPVQTASTTLVVRVDVPPLAPTAEAGGPYVFCPNQSFFLDGSGSVNPDEGQSEPGQPGDTIVDYAWELDGNAQFDDAAGVQPDVTAFFTTQGVGDYLVQLRVTDRTSLSFPSSGEPDLTDTDTGQVFVRDASDAACAGCIGDLAARAKRDKVQLTWTHVPGTPSYNVYRGTTQGGPYAFIGSTDSTYSTYLDTTVVLGTVYYYVVRPSDELGTEVCQSNEVSALPQERVRRRGGGTTAFPPTITSTPMTLATEGLTYTYDVEALDPNGDTLTYALDLAPGGMSIDPASGLIQWVPGNAQTGTQNVTVRVQDPGGLTDTQSFGIDVLNLNDPPSIVSSPVTDAQARLAYSYPVQAVDPDIGDTLTFSLDTAPAGMSIGAADGLVQWTPTDAQVGDHNVTLRVTDASGLSATQSYTVSVAEFNEPPSFTSSPVVQAQEGSLYSYDAEASDPNPGDTLTFSLDQSPAGMSIDPVTGLVQWTPQESQVGFADVTVRVTDDGGLGSTQAYQIAALNQNDPPSITSTPVTTAVEDAPYTYDVDAVDPDTGDVLTFGLTTAPAGMSIDPSTGLIQWTPGDAQANLGHGVGVQVSDSAGLTASQGFTVSVANTNDPPVITSVPVTVAGEGVPYTYDVEAVDPDAGDSLTFSLDTAPTGMSIDPATGLIQWTPDASQSGGTQSVAVRVSDSALADTQTYAIAVSTAAELIGVPDVVGLTQADAESAVIGASLTVGAVSTAFDGTVPAGHVIGQSPVAGASVPEEAPVDLVVSLGPVQETVPDVVGLPQADAEATIFAANLSVGAVSVANSNSVPAGQVIAQTPVGGSFLPSGSPVDLVVSNGPDNLAPVATITTPANGSELSGVVDIIGTADDANLRSWTLDYASAGSNDWVTIASDTTPVVNGLLGQLDLGLLRPDPYLLRLTAFDDVQSTDTLIQIRANDQMQLGQFELIYEDLQVPNLGLNIVLRRVYDTKQPGAGEFGRGWRLALTDLEVREDAANNVFVTLPDGRRRAFAFTPTPVPFPFSFLSVPGYTAPAGVFDSLEAVDCGLLANSGGQWFCFPGPLYDPDTYVLTTKEGRVYTISQADGLQRLEDRNGNFIQIDAGGIQSSSGRNVTFTRDAEGRITAITDPNGNVQTYDYDTAGRLIQHTDRNGNVTTYDYLADSHLMTDITAPAGCQPVRNEYIDGRLSARIDASGNVTTYTYDLVAGSETVTDANGNATTYFYDDLGDVERVIGPLGSVTEMERDADGNVTRQVDPSGRVMEKTYDANGNQTSQTVDPAGLNLVSTYTYNAFGQTTSFVGPDGNGTEYTYDANGNLLNRAYKDGLGTLVAEESFTYDAAGNRLTHIHEDGSTTLFTYDGFGNIVTETPPDTGATAYEHDAMGNRTALIDPLGNRNTFSFDGLGNPTGLTHGGVPIWSATYDEEGRRTSLTDANGAVTTFGYDCTGNLVQVTDALGNVTGYQYDGASNLTDAINALGRTTTFVYDAIDRQVGRITPDGETWGFDYSADGLLDTFQTPNSDSTSQTYDPAERIVQRVEPERTLTYTYDGNSRLLSAQEDYGGGDVRETTWTYDAQGQVLSYDDRNGRTIGYTRNARGDRQTVTTPDGRVTTYAYDGMQRPTQIATDGDSASYTYDAAGNLVRKDFSNGASETYTYDGLNRLTGVTVEDGLGNVVVSFDYTLDGNGQRIAVTLDDGAITYSQDDLYRLTSELISSASLGSINRTYSYDATGNRTDPGAVFGLDGRIEDDGAGVTYTYDANGNRIETVQAGTPAATYVYDSQNRLVGYTDASSNASYAYDYVGRRDRKEVNGGVTEYLYDRQNVVAEYDGAGNPVARYTHGPDIDSPLMVVREGRTWFYHTDGLGSVVAITDDTGAVAHRYGYDAWGNLILDSGSFSLGGAEPVNVLTYTGREYDQESGLYHYRARAYDPSLGRFLQKDPQMGVLNVPQSQHPYAYARNNPVNLTDPMGQIALLEYALILTTPNHQQAAAALIGFMHGFGSTNIVFVGHVLELSSAGNVTDVGAFWDEAIARTERTMDEIKSALGVAEQASDLAGVADIPGAFLNGATFELGFSITALGHKEPFSIERSPGGFKNGVDQGLAYLRSLRPF